MRADESEDAKRARSLFGPIEPIAPLGYQRMADAPKDQRIIGIDEKGVEKLMCWWRGSLGGWMAITAAGVQLGFVQPIGWKSAKEWGFDL